MKLTIRRTLALVLGAAMLLAVLPAVSADAAGEEVIYHRVSNGDITEDLSGAWETNAAGTLVRIDTEGRNYAVIESKTAAGKNENTQIDIDLDFIPENSGSDLKPYGTEFAANDYETVRLHFTYAYRYDLTKRYYNLGQLEKTRVYLSCDNGVTWTEGYADITAQNYLGDGAFYGEADPLFSLYEVVCDLTDILPAGKKVTTIRIEPVGDYGLQSHGAFYPSIDLHEVKVVGYRDASDAPALAEAKTIPVSEDALRQIVVQYIKEKASGVEWTPKETVEPYLKGYLHKGVPRGAYDSEFSSSYERFISALGSDGLVAPVNGNYYGMDGAAAFCDVITMVSRAHINGLAQSADTNRLIPLGGLSLKVPGSEKPNWQTGHAGITAEQAYESYALVKPGDIFISTKDSSQGMFATGETTVVRDGAGRIDPAASTVVVTNTPGSVVYYHYMQDGAEVVTTAAPYQVSDEYLYGSAWSVDNEVTFEQLWNGCAATKSKPQIMAGHMAYTLYEYTRGAVDQVEVQTSGHFDPLSTRNGVRLGVSSNYRLVSANAVLTDTTSGKVVFDDTYYFNWSNFSGEYNDPALNEAMAQLPVGTYNIKVTVKTGPITDPALLEVPEHSVLDQDFRVIAPRLGLSADRNRVDQGDELIVRLNAGVDGIDKIAAGVQYDTTRFEFDQSASRAANPGFEFEVSELTQTVTVSGKTDAGVEQTIVSLYFTAVRTADGPVEGEDAPRFTIVRSDVAQDGGVLEEGGSKGLYAIVEVGYNIILYTDFLPGYDMLLVNTNEPAAFAYDGQPMYDLSDNGYLMSNGRGYACVYGYLAPNAKTDLLTVAEQSGPILKHGADTNMSGWLDLNDAQQVANVINAKVTPATDIVRCIVADVNKDGRVDKADLLAVWNELR